MGDQEKDATQLPRDFVAYRVMWSSPQRFVENKPGDWDQFRWSADGHWTFFDNHGDESVAEYYAKADFVFAKARRDTSQRTVDR